MSGADQPRVVSASRRTDLPKWYPDWLEDALARGEATFRHPRGRLLSVSLEPELVHTFVLWSKDYSELFSRAALLERLRRLDPFFHFTLTGLGGSPWEPGVPAPREALRQMAALAGEFGPERLAWRFDPIIVWDEPRGGTQGSGTRTNLEAFEELAPKAAQLGVRRVHFSFVDLYPKVMRRAGKRELRLRTLGAEEREAALEYLNEVAAANGLTLAGCAGTASGATGSGGTAERAAACIDARYLDSINGRSLEAEGAEDLSQRDECRCTKSVDIGSYAMPCRSGCVYCYATPA